MSINDLFPDDDLNYKRLIEGKENSSRERGRERERERERERKKVIKEEIKSRRRLIEGKR